MRGDPASPKLGVLAFASVRLFIAAQSCLLLLHPSTGNAKSRTRVKPTLSADLVLILDAPRGGCELAAGVSS
jgi:hypothetical protein